MTRTPATATAAVTGTAMAAAMGTAAATGVATAATEARMARAPVNAAREVLLLLLAVAMLLLRRIPQRSLLLGLRVGTTSRCVFGHTLAYV
jgi:hypothetical protein